MTYFNTTKEVGAALKSYESQAATQEQAILEFFQSHPGDHTPSEIWRLVLSYAPLTSVRRAITCLTDRGDLEKTTNKRKGAYGRPEYCWRVAPGQERFPW